MATVTKPIALDESFKTNESPSRNIADVLAEELARIAGNILPPNASQIAYDNTASGLTATNVQDAIDEVISSQADVIADTMADLTENKTAVVTDEVADFETIDGSLVKSLVVEIEPSQSGSGTPSPDNIRPITGWTQEDVTVVGKNRFNPSTITLNTIINNDGSLTSNNFINTSDYIIINEQAFTVLNNSTANDVYIRAGMYDENYNFIRRDASPVVLSKESYTFSNVTGVKYVRISYEKSSNNELQLELGNKATVYEPYHGKTYTTPFGQTVYGGTLDVLTGELTIDRQFQSFDGSENWQANTTGTTFFYVAVASLPTGSEVVCNEFENKPITTINDDIGVSANANSFRCRPSTSIASDVATFKTWLSTHPIEIVRYITTPTTLSLTPQTVKALVGENHIQASTGDVLECKFSMLINGDDLAQIIGG